jgi:hypothetical protein
MFDARHQSTVFLNDILECTWWNYWNVSNTNDLLILWERENKENESDRINIKDDMEVECVAVIFIFSIVVSTLIFNKKPPNNPHGSKPTKHIPTEMT